MSRKNVFRVFSIFVISIILIILFNITSISNFIIVWYFWLIISLYLYNNRLVISIYIVLTMFSTSAYVAANLGYIYFYIPKEIIEEVTSKSLFSILLSYLITIALLELLGNKKMLNLKEVSQRFQNEIEWIAPNKILLLNFVLLVILSYFYFNLLINVDINSFITNPRAVKQQVYGVVAEHYFQVFIFPTTLIMVLRFIKTKSKFNFISIILLILLWIPLVLIGERKVLYLIVLGILLFGGFKPQKIISVGIVSLLFFLFLPLVREGWLGFDDWILSFHEFILPQYFSFLLHTLHPSVLETISSTSGYLTGAQALLPSFFRIFQYEPLGLSFYNLDLTNVGIAANPIGEAYINFGEKGYFIFSFLFSCTLILLFYFSEKNYLFWIVGLPYTFLAGRSDLWISFFFIIYSYLLLSILMTRKKIIK
ncbi:hypothetical protein H4O14_01355 [Bacillus sp. PAMC26568]|nr:hypothetical protein H4O14_01355 [Bacillus sp. PAMC26568]